MWLGQSCPNFNFVAIYAIFPPNPNSQISELTKKCLLQLCAVIFVLTLFFFMPYVVMLLMAWIASLFYNKHSELNICVSNIVLKLVSHSEFICSLYSTVVQLHSELQTVEIFAGSRIRQRRPRIYTGGPSVENLGNILSNRTQAWSQHL